MTNLEFKKKLRAVTIKLIKLSTSFDDQLISKHQKQTLIEDLEELTRLLKTLEV